MKIEDFDTPKHAEFVANYFKLNMNATRAYKAAYGYNLNDNTAAVSASNLLKNEKIRRYVLKRLSEAGVTDNKVIEAINSPRKLRKSKIVYLIKESFMGLVKIGKAVDPISRLNVMQIGCPQELELVTFIKSDNASEIESVLHQRFINKHYRGEWFRLTEQDILSVISEYGNGDE